MNSSLSDRVPKSDEQHTPGPWVWYSEDASMAILCRKSNDAFGVDLESHVLSVTICKNCQEGDHWQWGRCYTANAADARLIAAAPELLEALKSFVGLRDSGLLIESDGYMMMVLDQANAAIAKATQTVIREAKHTHD